MIWPSGIVFVFYDKNSYHDYVNLQNSNKTYFKMICEYAQQYIFQMSTSKFIVWLQF